jgi:hypothetical protein
MSRFIDRRETAWIVASVSLGLAGIAGSVWTTYGVECAVAAFIGGSLMPLRDLVKRSTRKITYPAPIEDVGSPERTSNVYRDVLACFEPDADKGHVRFDVMRAVTLFEPGDCPVSFADDEETIEVVTRINLWSFEGSPYSRPQDAAFVATKRWRNAGIAKRNRLAFAALHDRRNPDLAVGFTSILPLTPDGARRYFTPPGVADNSIEPDMVALEGQRTDDLLLFALGQLKLFRGNKVLVTPGLEARTARYREQDARTAVELLRTVCYQLGVVIASMESARELRVVSQTNIPGVQRALRLVHFRPTVEIETGDAEQAFVLLLMPLNAADARRHLQAAGVLAR